MAQAAIPVKGTTNFHLGWLGIGAIVVAIALGAGLIGYYAGNGQAAPATPRSGTRRRVPRGLERHLTTQRRSPRSTRRTRSSRNNITGETNTGLPAIQAKISDYLTNYQFVTKAMSAPIRAGDKIVMVVNYGPDNAATETGLAVMQLKDGKIVKHTVSPMP